MADQALWYGTLTENVSSAICRDLLVAAMLECERQGLPIVLHVHDELICEASAANADADLRQLATIMSTAPNWATGFPLEVEGHASERYLKIPPTGSPAVKARGGIIL
jgi:DNA polymerase